MAARTTRPARILYGCETVTRAESEFRDILAYFNETLPDGTRKGSAILAMMIDDTAERVRGLLFAPARVCCLDPECKH